MLLKSDAYPASLEVDYPKKLSRLSTFFRLLFVMPILFVLLILSGGAGSGDTDSGMLKSEEDDKKVTTVERTAGGDTTTETITETTKIENGKKVTVTESVVEGEEPTFQVKTEDLADVSIDSSFTTGGLGIVGGLFVATALLILFRRRYPKWWFDFNLEFNKFTTRISAYLFLLTDKYPSTVEEQDVHLGLEYPNVEKDLNRWLPLIKWLLALPHYIVLFFLMIAAFFAVVIAWFAILLTGRYPKDLFDFVVGVMRWSWRVNAYAFLLTTDRYPQFSLK